MDIVQYYLKNREQVDFKYSKEYEKLLLEIQTLERIFLSKQTTMLEKFDELENKNIDNLFNNNEIW